MIQGDPIQSGPSVAQSPRGRSAGGVASAPFGTNSTTMRVAVVGAGRVRSIREIPVVGY
jgi:hypothetical protein